MDTCLYKGSQANSKYECDKVGTIILFPEEIRKEKIDIEITHHSMHCHYDYRVYINVLLCYPGFIEVSPEDVIENP